MILHSWTNSIEQSCNDRSLRNWNGHKQSLLLGQTLTWTGTWQWSKPQGNSCWTLHTLLGSYMFSSVMHCMLQNCSRPFKHVRDDEDNNKSSIETYIASRCPDCHRTKFETQKEHSSNLLATSLDSLTFFASNECLTHKQSFLGLYLWHGKTLTCCLGD
jgi:hypothetical protein